MSTGKKVPASKGKPTNTQIPGKNSTSNSYLLLGGVLLFTLFLFSDSVNHDFTNWDDPVHVIKNESIHSLSATSAGTMFKPNDQYMYHPLTILSYAINYSVSGLKPMGYHLTNLLFHLLNVVLVFSIFFLLFGNSKPAALASLLFAVHPLVSEPVNWVSGRKDVLFAFFFLSSLTCYIQFVKKKKGILYLFFSRILFLFAMLSKPMAASMPLVLILTDIYFNRKFSLRLMAEKIPFFLIAGLILLIPALHSASANHNPEVFSFSFHESFSLFNRIFLSINAAIFYLAKFIAPYNLSAYHGFPATTDQLLPVYYYLSPLLVIVLCFVIYKIKKFRKELVSGFLFYSVTILPVVHLVSYGTNIYLAERYAYIPILGFIFIIISIYTKLNSPVKRNFGIIILSSILIFSVITFRQNKTWKNSTALWTHVIAVYPNDFYGYFNRANEEKELKKDQEAIADFNKSIELNPKFMEAWYNRANVKSDGNDLIGAIADFSKAIELKPGYFVAWFNRGNAKAGMGDFKEAIADYNEALRLKPDYKEALSNRGNAKGVMKDFTGSIEDYNQVIRINPAEAEAYSNRGLSRFNLNDTTGACNDWQKATQLGNTPSKEMMERFCH